MKPQLVLPAIAICVALTARLFADDPVKTDANQQTNPPTGRLTVVAPDGTGPVGAGDFLAAIAFTNQLGIEVVPVEPSLRAQLDLKEGHGVVVTSAASQGESDPAVLKPHDVVLQIDGLEIASPEKFHELAGGRQGQKAVFQVLRKGKPIGLEVAIPNTPIYQLANDLLTYNHAAWTDNQYRIGVTLAAADDVLRSQLRLADGEGLVITDVVSDGPSAKAGLRKHDVIVKLDGKRLTTVDACNTQVQEIKDRKVAATVFRGGKELSFQFAPQLSATAQLTTAPYVSAILLNDGANVHERWQGRVNLNNTGVDSIHTSPLQVHWHADLLKFMTAVDPSATTPAGEQIAQLKRQLEEMQKSLAALEATLRPAKTDQASPQSPEQKPQPPIGKPQR